MAVHGLAINWLGPDRACLASTLWLSASSSRSRGPRLAVLLDPQVPRELEALEHLLRAGVGQPDVRASHPPPATGYREEDLRRLGDQRPLQCGGEHQVAVP